jgi:NAD(P)H-hydrate repair Nnr-like enzyme with NAD(P)H-hydrate dehydratase domain
MNLKLVHFVYNSVSSVINRIVPSLASSNHKGSMGRIGVVGGSSDYCGAPYYAGVSSLKVGADLASVFCSQSAAMPIKVYSPELMVSPFYDDSVEDTSPSMLKKVNPACSFSFPYSLLAYSFKIYIPIGNVRAFAK